MASQLFEKTAGKRQFSNDETESLRLQVESLRTSLAEESTLRRRYESQLKQLSASLPIVIWMTDPEHRITFVSDNWYDLTGTGYTELGNWRATIHPEDRQSVIESLNEASSRRDRVAVEYRILKADGSSAWVLNLAAPRFCENGRYDGYVGAIIDISERKVAVEALQFLETRLTLALEGTKVGVWDWDIASGKVWLSDSALDIQGYSRGEIEGDAGKISAIVHPDDVQQLRRLMIACLKGEQPLVNIEHRLRRKSGGWIWVAERARVVERDAAGRALRMIGTRTDMTAQRVRDERIRWLAAHDVLTELPNRARFQEMLLAAMRETDAKGGCMALLLLDIDRFKTVNDTYGHDAGDALLRRVARRLESAFPPPAGLARLGGDEFAVILTDIASRAELETIAKRAILADMDAGDMRHDSTCSVGVALYPEDADNAADLVKRADVALYGAKDKGRACVLFFGG